MANEQNLVPFTSDQNREEAKKNGHKGGIASGEARRKKKMLKELLEEVAEKQVKNEKIRQTLAEMGFEDEDMNIHLAIAVRIAMGALNNDHKSISEFMDGTGQKITRNINENHNLEYKPLIDLTKRKKNGAKDEEDK